MESSQKVAVRNLSNACESWSDQPDYLVLNPCRIGLSYATLKLVSTFIYYIMHSPGISKQEKVLPQIETHKPNNIKMLNRDKAS